jgi:pyruvate dehydrogenase E2 component (dihydrolipoamide acetyltransferase)
MFTAEGSLAAWLKPTGAMVEVGEPLVEVTTEKTTQEIVAPVAGVVHQVAEVGASLPIQGLIGYILAAGEPPPAGAPASATPPSAPATPETGTPSAPRVSGERAPSSPIARRLAAEHGIDLSTVAGSGPGGRIVEADVQAAIARQSVRPPERDDGIAAAMGWTVHRRIPLVGMRRTIAERLRFSLSTAASVTLSRDVVADRLVVARQSLSASLAAPVSYDALFVRILAVALARQPRLNAVIDGDAILELTDINIGFAVSIDGGLLVPVVRAADSRPLDDLLTQMRQLSERALGNRLRPEDVLGGTATITNLGAYGVDAFTPILNPPQSAILGIGRILKRPVVVDDHLELHHTTTLSLTFDHRVADGVPAAQLLEVVVQLMNDDSLKETLQRGTAP